MTLQALPNQPISHHSLPVTTPLLIYLRQKAADRKIFNVLRDLFHQFRPSQVYSAYWLYMGPEPDSIWSNGPIVDRSEGPARGFILY